MAETTGHCNQARRILYADALYPAGYVLHDFRRPLPDVLIGLETASIPMAALVAFDKYRHHSAEAGAKYILTALFSSGLLLYGLSLIYGTVGTLYFADIPARLTGDPLQIMAFVFFFSGMGFKISLVPFHLWTADVYEGAPSTVTAYLSVISKGSAAFVLLAVLARQPVGMTSIFFNAAPSPYFIMAPFPNCFSICNIADSSAFFCRCFSFRQPFFNLSYFSAI